MKKTIKVLSVILSVCLLLAACSNTKNTDETTTTEDITNITKAETSSLRVDEKLTNGLLPYNEEDGLNPFFATTYENQYLIKLICYPLFSIDSDFNAVPVIAESIKQNGKRVSVSIKKGLECPGGIIQADDVVYSFNMAKSSSFYSSDLANIKSAMVSGTYTVDFNLNRADVFTAAQLVFPIVSSGTADNKSDIPIGYGAYQYKNEGLIPTNGEGEGIRIYSAATNDAVYNSYKVGNSSIYFNDLSNCNFVQSIGQEKDIQLSNMVYLGINKERGSLNSNIRSAIALLINSETIAEECYQGHATAVKIPSLSGKSPIENAANKERADRIINSCGYTYYAGKALTNGAYVLSFSLIVNKDNKYRLNAAYEIADRLNEAGFYIEVKALSFSDYKERIESGNYELYLGEVKLDYSFSLSQFFEKEGLLSAGVSQTTASSYFKMRNGSLSEDEYITNFVSDYPFVPICFRTGYVLYSNGLSGDFSRAPYDIYYSIFQE